MSTLDKLWKRYGHICLLVVFLLSLVPIVYAGRYAHPAADDYSYGVVIRQTLVDGTSILGGLFKHITTIYQGWQGTYSAILMMDLMPDAFAQGLYCITPVVMLGSLCLGTIKLMDTLICRCLGQPKRIALLFSLPLLLLSIQQVLSPVNSYFWWNGCSYYTFTYGIALLYVERLICLLRADSRKELLWALIPGLAAAVFIGGNNYVTALLSFLLGGLAFLCALFRRKNVRWLLLSEVVLLVCFLISVVAPGNAIRQASNSGMTAGTAIITAVKQGWEHCQWFTSLPTVLVLLALTPLMWQLAGKTGWRFRCPLLVLVLEFLLFSAQNTPHYYAVGWVGPDRLRNIVFYSYFWFLGFGVFYVTGWLRRLWGTRKELSMPVVRGAQCLLALLLLAACWSERKTYTSVEYLAALRDGSLAEYDAQMDARDQLYSQSEGDVTVDALTVCPPLLMEEDLMAETDAWQNRAVANYYGLDSVTVIPNSGE